MRCAARIVSALCLSAWLFGSVGLPHAAGDVKGKIKLPAKSKLHIYVLMGQSNMSGRGQVYNEDKVLNEKLLSLGKKDDWKSAAEPLHWDKAPGIAGVGPGRAFGEAMLREAEEEVQIGLVPCAETGSALTRWEKGGDLYGRTLKRARLAMKDGTLKGFLWQHGETDSASFTSSVTYGDRVREMISNLRDELGQGEVPFVCGEVSPLLPLDRFPAVDAVNKGLKELPKQLKNVETVPTNGLNLMADGIHFDGQSARVLGRRFAGTMRDVQKKMEKK